MFGMVALPFLRHHLFTILHLIIALGFITRIPCLTLGLFLGFHPLLFVPSPNPASTQSTLACPVAPTPWAQRGIPGLSDSQQSRAFRTPQNDAVESEWPALSTVLSHDEVSRFLPSSPAG